MAFDRRNQEKKKGLLSKLLQTFEKNRLLLQLFQGRLGLGSTRVNLHALWTREIQLVGVAVYEEGYIDLVNFAIEKMQYEAKLNRGTSVRVFFISPQKKAVFGKPLPTYYISFRSIPYLAPRINDLLKKVNAVSSSASSLTTDKLAQIRELSERQFLSKDEIADSERMLGKILFDNPLPISEIAESRDLFAPTVASVDPTDWIKYTWVNLYSLWELGLEKNGMDTDIFFDEFIKMILEYWHKERKPEIKKANHIREECSKGEQESIYWECVYPRTEETIPLEPNERSWDIYPPCQMSGLTGTERYNHKPEKELAQINKEGRSRYYVTLKTFLGIAPAIFISVKDYGLVFNSLSPLKKVEQIYNLEDTIQGSLTSTHLLDLEKLLKEILYPKGTKVPEGWIKYFGPLNRL